MVVIYTFVPFVLLLSSLSIIYIHIVQMEYIISFVLVFHVTKSSEINSFGLLQILLTQALERFPQSLAQLPSDSGLQ